jgi:GNAT superfamily N-acetyltransferase
LLIEPLTREHNRKSFDCGDEDVTRFLREKAMQDHERDLSRTMVLIEPEESHKRIIGYHTLVMTQVKQEEIPNDRPRITRGIPVILLGQLGVDNKYKGQGLGDILLMDVQARTDEISRKVGIRALMLDARNERLAEWYGKHDFIRFQGSLRMFKRIEAIRSLNLLDES